MNIRAVAPSTCDTLPLTKSGDQLRYYLYISDAKVDMIFPQVPQSKHAKVSMELGFDIKLLKGKLSSERTLHTENRIARLALVESYIRDNEAIGTLTSPASWIEGQIRAHSLEDLKGAVLFCESTAERTCILGGSKHHCIGNQRHQSDGRSDPRWVWDSLRSVQQYLRQYDDLTTDSKIEIGPTEVRKDAERTPEWHPQLGYPDLDRIEIVRNAASCVCNHGISPPQLIHFFAKLIWSESNVSVATPLFISLAG